MEIRVAVGNGADNANCTTAVNLLATDDEYDPDNPVTCSTDHSNPAVTIDWAVGAEDRIDVWHYHSQASIRDPGCNQTSADYLGPPGVVSIFDPDSVVATLSIWLSVLP